jgi:hypothetical protein
MKVLLAIAGFVFIAGCGSKNAGDKIISEFEGLKDRMCKCADKACADKVNEDTTKWMQKLAEGSEKDAKPTKEQDEKFDKLGDELKACAKKLGADAD